jgi:hypothetical protein
VPKGQGPEENRDDPLNPAVQRRHTARSRGQVGGCCVHEDTDHDVKGDQEALNAEESLQEVHSAHVLPADARQLRYQAVVSNLTRGNKFTSHHDSSRASIRRADTPDGRRRGSQSRRALPPHEPSRHRTSVPFRSGNRLFQTRFGFPLRNGIWPPQTNRLSSRPRLTARITFRSVKIFMPNGPWLSATAHQMRRHPGFDALELAARARARGPWAGGTTVTSQPALRLPR